VNTEKAIEAIKTRRGRMSLAHSMTAPITRSHLPHPCDGCGHMSVTNGCETIVHKVGERCWHPVGVLAIGGEKAL